MLHSFLISSPDGGQYLDSCLCCFISYSHFIGIWVGFNPLTPKDPYSGRTAQLTSYRCILYIYSRNKCTEYFKHGIYSSFFFSSKCSLFHNSNVFGSCIILNLYIQGVLKLKKNNSGAKRLKFTGVFWIRDDSLAPVCIQTLDLPVRNLGTTVTTSFQIFHHSTPWIY